MAIKYLQIILSLIGREEHNIGCIKHCVKNVQIRSFSGPYFPMFGLNMEVYGVNLRIQSTYGKIRIRKNSAFGRFLRTGTLSFNILHFDKKQQHSISVE